MDGRCDLRYPLVSKARERERDRRGEGVVSFYGKGNGRWQAFLVSRFLPAGLSLKVLCIFRGNSRYTFPDRSICFKIRARLDLRFYANLQTDQTMLKLVA